MEQTKITGIPEAVRESKRCNNGIFILEKCGNVYFHEIVSTNNFVQCEPKESTTIARKTERNNWTIAEITELAEDAYPDLIN